MIIMTHSTFASGMQGHRDKGVAVDWSPPGNHRDANGFEKVALSRRDRRRDEPRMSIHRITSQANARLLPAISLLIAE